MVIEERLKYYHCAQEYEIYSRLHCSTSIGCMFDNTIHVGIPQTQLQQAMTGLCVVLEVRLL